MCTRLQTNNVFLERTLAITATQDLKELSVPGAPQHLHACALQKRHHPRALSQSNAREERKKERKKGKMVRNNEMVKSKKE